ncbi:hypothetical protein [Thermincola potens]|uniref:Uncharacterized protein n=1 Tax=Thermincola potens (strain JR) TaxID=635013 RepID=D5XAI4_THEPJ|nr:hypothetical protein [Thermincola potens]ADG81283.1 hypothetical protein TherJR_0397 [Thermincola potens JR]
MIIAGMINAFWTVFGEVSIRFCYEQQMVGLDEGFKLFGVGFFTGFVGGLIPGFLIAKNIIREGKLLHRLIGILSNFSFDMLGNYMVGENIGPVDVGVALISSIIAVELGIRVASFLGEIGGGFIGSIIKFFGEGFKRWQARGFAIPGFEFFKAKFAPKVDNLLNIGAQNFNELVVEFKGIKVPNFGKRISIDVNLKGIGDSLSKGFSDIGNSLSEIDFDLDLELDKGGEATVDLEGQSKSE